MPSLKPLPRAIAVVLALALAAPAASAAVTAQPTIYVSPTGSDSATGDSTHPLRTLTRALSRAAGGERVVLRAGTYPAATDSRARTAYVDVVAETSTKPEIAGLTLAGGQRLRFSGLKFTAQVKFAEHPTLFSKQVTDWIGLRDSEITAPGQTCVYIKDASSHVTVERDWIHDCQTGIAGPYNGSGRRSYSVGIKSNKIERLAADGIQFGSWDDVKILYNTIREIRDPAGSIHNDGVQLTGASRGVQIIRNRISGSRTQLILIQDAMAPVDDVRVEANLLVDAGGVAVQSAGATNARFVNNTVMRARYGSLWLWPGMATKNLPTDTVVVNNLFSSEIPKDTVALKDGTRTAVSAGNLFTCLDGVLPTGMPAGVGCLPALGFANEAIGDYRLTATAPARAFGSAAATAGTDLDGKPFGTPPAPGAFA